MKNPAGVPPLIDSLKDKDSKVRRNAINALALIKDERAVIPLIKTLNDKNDEVRASTALALGWFGDRSAIEIRQGRGSLLHARPVDSARATVGGRVVEDDRLPQPS